MQLSYRTRPGISVAWAKGQDPAPSLLVGPLYHKGHQVSGLLATQDPEEDIPQDEWPRVSHFLAWKPLGFSEHSRTLQFLSTGTLGAKRGPSEQTCPSFGRPDASVCSAWPICAGLPSTHRDDLVSLITTLQSSSQVPEPGTRCSLRYSIPPTG